jgi:hypothetical protein
MNVPIMSSYHQDKSDFALVPTFTQKNWRKVETEALLLTALFFML